MNWRVSFFPPLNLLQHTCIAWKGELFLLSDICWWTLCISAPVRNVPIRCGFSPLNKISQYSSFTIDCVITGRSRGRCPPMISPEIHWTQRQPLFLQCGFPLFFAWRFQFFLLVFAGLFSFFNLIWAYGKISFSSTSGCIDIFLNVFFPHSRTISIIIISFASLEADIKWSTCTN